MSRKPKAAQPPDPTISAGGRLEAAPPSSRDLLPAAAPCTEVTGEGPSRVKRRPSQFTWLPPVGRPDPAKLALVLPFLLKNASASGSVDTEKPGATGQKAGR